MSDELDERPANSMEALDLHLRYMRRDVRKVLDAIEGMATKAEVNNLSARIDHLETRIDRPKESPFWRLVANITRLGAAIAVVVAAVGAFVTVVHFWDRVDGVVKTAK